MHRKFRHLSLIVVLLFALTISVNAVTQAANQQNSIGYEPQIADIQLDKIEPELQNALSSQGRANIFILFDSQPDLSAAYDLPWEQRGAYVVKTLQEAAQKNQANVRAYLESNEIPFQTFLIDGSIYIQNANTDLVNLMTAFPQVGRLRIERAYPIPKTNPVRSDNQIMAVEWGVGKINADDVWAEGFSGQGIVVANIDTGVRYTHNALINQYRGNLGGGSYDHTYSWSDPTGTYPSAPGDNHGHGTHTMGTIAGDDGGSNQIGVAPGAEWIACKGCTNVNCPDSYLNACADWILAPGGDSSMRPQVVNNSWGGCTYDNWYRTKVDAWRAAGIHPVFSAGNTGNCGYSAPFCGSIGTPGTYKEATAVGSTTSSDGISSFSLWGPSEDPTASNEIKPEVSAPGSSIRSASSSSNTGYTTMSGTSMAAPHVSGALAVIWSACPALVGDFDASEQLLMDSAFQIAYNTGCGNEGPGNIPNNAYGYGRIDVFAAYDECYTAGPTPTPTNTPLPTNTSTPTDTPVPTSTPAPVVFFDDFETNQGWTTDPNGSDTATTGMWERANPEETSYSGTIYQQGTTVSGSYDLVTEGSAGSSVGSYDIDSGVTSIRSPDITLPASNITLSFSYYLAHYNNGGSDDFLRVSVVGSSTQVVFEELASGEIDAAVWDTFSTSLDSFAGQTIYLLIEAADNGSGSLIEAAIDDVKITGEGQVPTATPTDPPAPTDTPVPTNTPTPSPIIFSDDFESNLGWTTDPNGSDTATTGMWERANPQETSYGGTVYQQGTTVSGSYDLVTEGSAGSSVGSYDIDNGVTSIRSPDIALPSSSGITLSFSYYLAHYSNGSSADFLRVSIVGSTTQVVFEELAAGNIDAAVWDSFSTSLDDFAGQTIYILIEAADGGSGSLIEAAIDDVVISQ